MADAVVSSVIRRVGDALIQEADFLHGVRPQVERMLEELEWMQCFLKDVDAKQQDGDECVRRWVAEIRDLSYRAEDVIDTFMLKRNACIFTKLVQQHKTRAEIEDIYTKIRDTKDRLERYDINRLERCGIKKISEGEGTSSSNQIQQSRRSYAHYMEEDVVGLEEDLDKMVAQLISVEKKYRFISIVGMGGSGKTTLAKEVYNHRTVKSAFDCCSWVYVSQECKPKDIFTSILNNVSSLDRKTLEKMKEEELVEKLYEILKEKRYLVVLDDIWSEDAWDRLKPAFPNGKMGSKILLTTRHKEVALHAYPWSPPHEARRLTDDESWNLLCKKAFPEDVVTSCGDLAQSFENLGRDMIKKCGNLPLAVVVLGGLLAMKSSLHEWELVHKNVTGHLSKGQQEHGVRNILALSYHDLPSHLKPCFLYLGIYPEDSNIPASHLILLWVAEGFVPKPSPPSQETMEDVAREWLEELAYRCMIQISKRGPTGSIKYCRVHDLMRDLCLCKAREEKFLEILIPSKSSESNVSSSMARKSRRNAIHYSGDERYVPLEQLDPNVRSLFLTGLYHYVSLKIEQAKPIFMNYHLIRVLDLCRVRIEGRTLPGEIGNLINLRFLSLFNSNVEEFPPSLGNLSNMQTLNIETSLSGTRVPDVIWKMDKLRHLYLPWSLDNENLRLDTLIALQTLKRVPCKFLMEKSAANLTNLKKLEIDPISTSEELDAFLESPVLEGIYSLSLVSKRENTGYQFSNLKRLSSCHNLSKLCVNGEISKLAQNDFLPPNLAKLKLHRTRLEQGPMAALGNLFNLRILCLYAGAYIGKEMICTSKAFPKLESLTLHFLQNLEELRVEEGAMPCLRWLRICHCQKLRMIPEGLRFITTLQELKIESMPKAFGNRIRVVEGKDGEDLYKVQHIPSIQIIFEKEKMERISRVAMPLWGLIGREELLKSEL